MTATVAIVDYGVGNLFSVARAIEKCGGQAHLANTAATIEAAERLILPGVGAFAIGIGELEKRGLREPVLRYCATGKPFLGICLGMQLMFERSYEFGESRGLGLLRGAVVQVPGTGSDGQAHKVPHIGWNGLLPCGPDWDASLLQGIPEGAAAYFVHSFAAEPAEPADCVAYADYDGFRIAAVIRRGNLHGCQFHPERSGRHGLHIMRNFLSLPTVSS